MQNRVIAVIWLSLLSAHGLAADAFVGRTVAEVSQVVGADLASGTLIDEPPAVVRGIEFRLRDGAEVQLFVKRGQVPLMINGGNNPMLLKDLKVTGFRRVEKGLVYCEGDVLWHFACGADVLSAP